MALPAMVQLAQAGWFLLAGAGLGLLYDLLGGLRDKMGLPAPAGDGLFALAAVSALFLGGMASLEGRPRLYMALVTAMGLGIWRLGASPVVRPAAGKMWALGARGARFLTAPVRRGMSLAEKKPKKALFKRQKMVYNNSHENEGTETAAPDTERSGSP